MYSINNFTSDTKPQTDESGKRHVRRQTKEWRDQCERTPVMCEPPNASPDRGSTFQNDVLLLPAVSFHFMNLPEPGSLRRDFLKRKISANADAAHYCCLPVARYHVR